jgi:hypothetical protein
VKTRCDECGKPFGLIRWRRYRDQLCSKLCRAAYQANWERTKAYLKWLYAEP